MKKTLIFISLLTASFNSFAGRPLGTDDAATAEHKTCQFEAWRDRGQDSHSWTMSPACGLGEFEIGAEFSRTTLAEGEKERAGAASLKWAPEMLKFGPVGFGAKAWTGRARAALSEDGWRPSENGAIAIATWDIGAGFSTHANLGTQRDRIERRSTRLANLALSWVPHERVQLFVEALTVKHEPTTQTAGLRLWAIPEKFGIDFTSSRSAGVPDSRSFNIGFGWYGIFGD